MPDGVTAKRLQEEQFPDVAHWADQVNLGLVGVVVGDGDDGEPETVLMFTINWWESDDDQDSPPRNILAIPLEQWNEFMNSVHGLNEVIDELRLGINTIDMPEDLAEYAQKIP